MADLSLRQHYALSAMAALTAGHSTDDVRVMSSPALDVLVEASFMIADAMIAFEKQDNLSTDRRLIDPPSASIREAQEHAKRFAQQAVLQDKNSVITDIAAKAIADRLMGYTDDNEPDMEKG